MDHRSRDGWMSLRILGLSEWRTLIVFVSLGLVVVWLGIRCLMPGIRGRVSAGCTFVKAVQDNYQLHLLDLSEGCPYAQIFPSRQLLNAFASFLEAISRLF